MQPKMIKFLNSIKIENFNDFDLDFITITKSNYDLDLYLYSIKKESGWCFRLFEEFFNALSNIKNYKYEITFSYPNGIENNSIIEFINDWYFNKTFIQPDIDIQIENKQIIIIANTQNDLELIKSKQDDLESLFRFINYDYYFELQILKNKEEESEEKQERIDLDEAFKPIKEKSEELALKDLEENYSKMIEERKNRELFKRGDYEPFSLNDINENSGAVDINGKLFQADIKTTKNGRLKVDAGIYDDNNAVFVTIIESRSISDEEIKLLKPGMNIRILGRCGFDKFKREVYIMAHKIFLLPEDPLRDDLSEEKRVELHLHTNMSEMDGISSIETYCKLAKHMGHKAIALNDHGVVQSFPLAQIAGKKYGLKILYGSELYMIDDYLKGTLNSVDVPLNNASYVVFDLESTGLSIRYDRITEFGAVKIVNGREVDKIDILINPEMEISKFIEKKTNITNEMVKKEKPIRDVLPKILDFIKGSILISHNIEFDYNMLNQALIDNGYDKLVQPAIDTLQISRYIYPQNASHRLGALCKRLDVRYDEESAHRADYDASVLSSCWFSLLLMLVNKKPDITHRDLEKLTMNKALLKQRGFFRSATHVNVLVKNTKGLKDLYELISISHDETLGSKPFIKRSELEKRRENLLLGSACFNGEVFYSSYRRGQDELKKAISFYDFIEIQPLNNYMWLVNAGEIPSEDILKRYIVNIIETSQKQGKIIVATGDTHYANPQDKKFRDVIIESTGVGTTYHPLSHGKSDYYFPNPDQHYRSTEEMLEAFRWLGEDIAHQFVIKNTNYIADLIEDISPIPPGLFPPKIDNSDKLLRELCFNKAHELYGENLPKLIEDRLDTELNGIISNGYAVIYYISHLLVKMSNDQGYIVGSRGSVGSSFAATMASITEVNPLPPHYRCPKCKYVEFSEDKEITSGFDLPAKKCPHCGEDLISDGQSIPFQVFLGFNAEKTPDIDLNFPADFQLTAHLFTKDLLGEKNVYRAGTISTIQLKTAIGNVKKSYLPALNIDPSRVRSAYQIALAYGCQGVKRTTGQHPGGIVVIPKSNDVCDFTPVQFPADKDDATWKTTHFDYDALHETLLKFDMLGHVDPQASKMMSDLTGVDCRTLPMNDKKVISIFSQDEVLNLKHKYLKKDNGALGLPEFGTNFVRQMLRETKPQNFKELLIISGLSHGTNVWTNNQQDLIKEGKSDLKGLIGCRDDIMQYLISVGVPPIESFKIMETVRKNNPLSDKQISLMKEHGVSDQYIETCHKIQYLFPKGHACAYVMMAMRVAYYKVYHPLEYYATFFTLRCNGYDIETMSKGIDAIYSKIQELEERRKSNDIDKKLSTKEEEILKTLGVALEMAERGYTIENINIEKSDAAAFLVNKENNSIIPPLKVLDGLGEDSSNGFIKARSEKMFTSLEDIKQRGKLSSSAIEEMKRLHVFDNIPETDQLSLFDFSF